MFKYLRVVQIKNIIYEAINVTLFSWVTNNRSAAVNFYLAMFWARHEAESVKNIPSLVSPGFMRKLK